MTEDSAEEIVTAALLIIGNEILSGRTQDANLAYIAKGLGAIGVRLREVRVIPDVAATIIATVNEVRAKFDYVFTTGGIGPTHDDITSETIAQAFGVPWVLHPEAKRLLLTHYKESELNAARLRMAHVPAGATLIDNPVSLAPGFQIGNVFVMAGVPRIMQAMFDGILPRLKRGAPMLSRTVRCTLPEGIIAEGLGKLQDRYAELDIGSYPYFRRGAFGTALVLRGTDELRLGAATAELVELIRSLGGEPLEGEAPEA
ncbi:MAG: competence/damage-inducible protein [Rhodospirillales bacterium]|jgi:molybdenum cofactor synthesis domain-containing protein|nr:competence/damage-inducible protein [Rhodospirillales bacterium]